MSNFLQTEINLDIGHVLILAALIGLVVFLACKYRSEGLNVPQVVQRSCHCKSCQDVAYEKLRNNEYYGCRKDNPLEPYSEEQCYLEYRKALLTGCNVAS
jgi:hypothetical protein